MSLSNQADASTNMLIDPIILALQPQPKLDPNNFFGRAKCLLCCLPIKALQKLIWHPHAHHRRLWMANERGRGRDGKKDATFEMGSASFIPRQSLKSQTGTSTVEQIGP